MTQLRIHLLGGFHLERHEHPLPAIPSLAARSLLAYLIIHQQRAHTRTLLIGLFWPELPEDKARRRLSQALWQIRRALHNEETPNLLLTQQESVQFNSTTAHWLDVAEFEQNLATPQANIAQLRQVAELYQGDFLAGFYDDWVLIERERLRDRYLESLNQLIRACKGQGLHQEALNYAGQLARYNPLREEAHREVMRLCFLLDRPHEALQQFEQYRAILAEELGDEPSAQTTRLYHDIRAHLTQATAQPTRPETTIRPNFDTNQHIIGRSNERALLIQAIEHMLTGRGDSIWLEGPAGIGKTHLLQRIAQDAMWRGVHVLWGHGREFDQASPYSLLRQILRDGLTPLRLAQLSELVEPLWLRELGSLLPQLAQENTPPDALPAGADNNQLLTAITQTCLALQQIAPHLIILDNLHWADEATLTVLAHLARHLPHSRFLVVGSCRPDVAQQRPAVWQTLRQLDKGDGLGRLSLAPFSPAETAEMVSRELGMATAAPNFSARLHKESGGNPLFVREMLRALVDAELLQQDNQGAWHTPWDDQTTDYAELPLAPALQQIMTDRLSRLPASPKHVLGVAAVLGDPFTLPMLLAICDLPRQEIIAALALLLQRGLCQEAKTTYIFAHDRFRRLAYEGLSAARRRVLHGRAGEWLASSRPDQNVTLAHHFTEAHLWEKALDYHWQTAVQAERVYAYPIAHTHYQTARQLGQKVNLAGDKLVDLQLAHEQVLSVLGERTEQEQLLSDLLERVAEMGLSPGRVAQLYSRYAQLLFDTGRLRQAENTIQKALTLTPQPNHAHARQRQILGTILHGQGHYEAAIPHLQTAIRLFQQSGQTQSVQAEIALATLWQALGRYASARHILEHVLTTCRTAQDRLAEARVLSQLGIVHRKQGNLTAAEQGYREAMAISQAIGYSRGIVQNSQNLATLKYYQGDISHALDLFDETVRLAQEVGDRRQEAVARSNSASIRSDMLGDDERAEEDVQFTLLYARQSGDKSTEAHALGTLAEIARRRGQLDVARRHLELILPTLAERGEHFSRWQLQRTLALVHLEAGETQEAIRLLTEAEAMCRQLGLLDLAISMQAIRGKALLEAEQVDKALAATSSAIIQLKSGVDQDYLIYFWHSEVLRAAGREEGAVEFANKAYVALLAALEGLSAEQKQLSLVRLPEHRAIVAAIRGAGVKRVQWRLPRVGVPPGRAIRADEWETITWTVTAPDDQRLLGKKARRQHKLLRLLQEAQAQNGAPRVQDLAGALQVVPKTIKRDLAQLRQAGHTVLTRGSRKTST